MMSARRKVTVGIDLGGTSVRVGLCDAAMELVASCAMPTRVAAGPQSVIDEVAGAVRALLADGAYEPLGVGIGSPGPLNLRTGVLGLLPNLPGWDNFPLREALSKALGVPVILESDANAAAIAEWKLGAARDTGLTSMAMLTLGTGVGSGIILNGRVWHGMFGMGGEVGHATLRPDGPRCGCGSHGCLEMYASAGGLMRIARTMADAGDASPAVCQLLDGAATATPRALALLAEAGDACARQVFAQLGTHLGIGVANVLNTLDLPLVVIGGGVASAWSLFAASMFKAVYEYSVVYRLAEPRQRETLEADRTFICPAVLGPKSGLLGAAMLPLLAAQTAA